MPKIIAIHSYRGGTGKSNLVANLATLMALERKRVAIVDMDLQSPGVHNIFDLDEGKISLTLNDYLWNRCSIGQTAYNVSESAGIEGMGEIYLIPSSVDPDEIAHILSESYDVTGLNQGLREFVNCYQLDYLFLDTHPGLSKETFLSIAMSNLLILVLRPDRQDFEGTAVMVDLAQQLMIPKMLLVVNKVLQTIDFNDLKRQLENTYQTTVAGILPVSEEMIELGSNGIFCQEYPDHLWTIILSQIAEYIMNCNYKNEPTKD